MADSIAVLSLLTVLLVQSINGTSRGIQSSGWRIDADQEARTVFDRIGGDLTAMPKDPGIDFIFSKQEGNDKLFFYSEMAGNFSLSGTDAAQARSPISLVGYRIGPSQTSSRPILLRVARGLKWDAAPDAPAMAFLTCSGSSYAPLAASTLPGTWSTVVGAAPDYEGTDPDFGLLSEFVYRMEFCFQLKDGTYSNTPLMAPAGATHNLHTAQAPTPADDSLQGYSAGSRWYDTAAQRGYLCINADAGAAVWRPLGMEDVSSVIVAIAVLDPAARKAGSDLAQAVAAFADPTDEELAATPPKLMAAKWDETRNQAGFAKNADLNANAASRVYIYQRYFNITSQ